MDLQLSGRTAFIAASSKGLGLAVGKRLAEEGANVVLSSRSSDNLETARDELLSETSADENTVVTTKCNVTNRDEIENAIETAVETFSGLDILVNNHGGPPAVNFDEATDAHWDDAYKLVIKSNVWLTATALPYLQESNDGAIATVTSASAKEPLKNHVLSNVFRLGLYGLMKSVAKEYPSVRSNVVAPRFVMTERLMYKVERRAHHRDISEEEALRTREEEVILNRSGEPKEFADTVSFVVSPRASYITGDVIRVDGGWTEGVL